MSALVKHSIAVALVWFATSAVAWDVDQSDDPAAHEASRQSLSTLGPDQGSQSLIEDIRVIGGLDAAVSGQGLALVATVEELNEAIRDLGANVQDMEISVALASDVLFDFDKADIKPAALTELQKLGLIIREKRTGDVTITGHTDSKGSDSYNMKLSDRRAAAVKNWLVTYAQINADVINTRGLGESDPIAPNSKADGSDDTDGRTKNRRVDIVIQTNEASK
ncbi:MAG: OmpA family protein [Halioglobus sp.]|nr:OmpA family protein [Halioglobus sp.]